MRKRRLRTRIGALLLGSVLVGILAGVLWWFLTPSAGYTVGDNLGATMGERALSELFVADLTFTVIAALLGIGIGVICWFWFQQIGWWMCLLAIIACAIVGALMWQTGQLISPNDFDARLAAAKPGDVVPVDLRLRSLSALLVAPFVSMLPVMLLAAFWPQDEH